MKNVSRIITVAAMLMVCLGSVGCTSAGQLMWQPVAPGADPLLVNAERADQAAFATIDEFVNFEHENQAFVKENIPAAHEFAESMRRQAPRVFRDLRLARATYKQTRLSDDATTLETQLMQVQNWASQARLFIAMIRERNTAAKK